MTLIPHIPHLPSLTLSVAFIPTPHPPTELYPHRHCRLPPEFRGQPLAPPPLPPSLSPAMSSTSAGLRPCTPCQVRCAGCRLILAVAPGFVEFVCPSCRLPQMLPPELLKNLRPSPPNLNPSPPVLAHGIDPNKLQLPCVNCKALLNVPHGLPRFKCPQCQVDLAIDLSKIKHLIPPLPLPPEEVNEVDIEVEREKDEGGTVGKTFTDYCPPKLSLSPSHPDPIVETSSLAAVQPPEPTYDLAMKDEIECSKALSCLQLETVVYASQRHLQHLQDGSRAGFFIGDGVGVGKGRTIAGLIWENWKHGRQKALWISVGSDLKFDAQRDLHNIGATCVEVHELPYGKVDSNSVGIGEGVLFLTYSSLVTSSEKGCSRLNLLVQWCGSQFDGIIIFDECDKAKTFVLEAGSQPTRTGEAVLELQERLPEARVVYSSATGASEPWNLGCMVRLGLWGSGTAFSNFQEFLAALGKLGVGAVELVAMDMKARGMFVCRTLSYKGVEFEVVEASLDAKMTDIYNKAAEFWAELRVELLTLIATYHEDKPASSFCQLWRMYWASHQRFFRHLCMSAKVPTVVRLAKQALTENKCVVIDLQSTGEGLELDDFISGPHEVLLKFVEAHYPLPEKPETVPDVKELPQKRHSANPDIPLEGQVRKAAKRKSDSDEECYEDSQSDVGNESSESDDEFQICEICNGEENRGKLLKCTCSGQSVHPSCLEPPTADVSEEWTCNSCKQKTQEYLEECRAYIEIIMGRYKGAVERKEKILEIIRSLDLPKNPLDDIIDQLGGPDNVAEITGRRGTLVSALCDEGVTYQARNTNDVSVDMVNMHEKQLFMDGEKFIAIISDAGSAVCLQADRRFMNQRRRVHLTLELPWTADKAIQQFGKTHRSNQSSAPEYRLLFTSLGGERLFASIVARRMESLGALTQVDCRAGPSLIAYNYDSLYGKKALLVMYRGIIDQDSLPVMPPGCSSGNPQSIQDFIAKAKAAMVCVGIVREPVSGESAKGCGHIIESDVHDVGRFFYRLLGLPPEIQNRFFALFISILDAIIQNARTEGNIDSGVIDIRANTIELQGKPKIVHVDHVSGASTMLFTFMLDRGTTWELASGLLNEKQKAGLGSANDGFYESRREWLGRRHFLLAFEGPTSGMFKIIRPAVGEAVREMPLSELRNKFRMITSLEKAHSGWEDEYEVSSRQCMHGPNCKFGSYCTVGRRLQEVNVLGGSILPIWKAIEKLLSKQASNSHRRICIVRIETTTDSQQIVGLLIPNAAVEDVLQGAGEGLAITPSVL